MQVQHFSSQSSHSTTLCPTPQQLHVTLDTKEEEEST